MNSTYRPPTTRRHSSGEDYLLFGRDPQRSELFVAAIDLRDVPERKRVAAQLSSLLHDTIANGTGGLVTLAETWEMLDRREETFAGIACIALPHGRPDRPLEMAVAAEGTLAVFHGRRRLQGKPGPYELAQTPRHRQSLQIVRGVHPLHGQTEHGMALMELTVGGLARERGDHGSVAIALHTR